MSRAAILRAEPLAVQPRWLLHVALLLAMLVAIAVLIVIRRGDLDVDDNLFCAALIVGCLWVFALGAGSLVRSVRAGHALRLDPGGLHLPGLEVVPWSAIESADLRTYESGGKRFRQMVVHTDRVDGPTLFAAYERYVFGPLAGLRGHHGRIVVTLALLDIDADALLAATRAFIEVAGARATMRANVAVSATVRQRPGQRLP